MISETDKAYLAGLIDGEGCISILSHTQNGRLKHTLNLKISSSDLAVLNYLRDKYEMGYVSCSAKDGANGENCRAVYAWGASSQKARILIEMAMPYMLIKKEQADIAIKFQETMRPVGHYGAIKGVIGSGATPDETVYQRERYKQALSQLKGFKVKRGRPKEATL
jgi:hypothetical protein